MATMLPPSLTLRVRWFKTWLDPSRARRRPRCCWQCCDQGYVRVHSARFAYSGQMAQEIVVTATEQSPAAPSIDATRLRVAIARLSRRLRHHQLAGLTPTQLSALATVERHGPMRLGDVAAAEGIAPSTLTRLVTALEEHAYVERCAVPGDARASTLTITTRGRQILQRIRQESTAMLAESLAMLPPDQIEVLAQALPALEQLAEIDPRDPQPR
jgi:DNA-binding MarR family transcriptional regulator